MKRKIRWGVIGSGGIARRRTIPEGILAASNAVLAAVYDLHAEVNREVARQVRARAAVSLDDLLGPDVDAVYIATPVRLHAAQAMRAARAGKHVLCEKPLAMTVAETRRMAADCRRAGITLGTAFMMRFQTQHQAALALARAGRLGRLVYGRAQLSCWYPRVAGAWRQDPAQGGGGSLIDMGGHCIDLLEMFFGPARAVSCFTGRLVQGYRSEDSATVLIRFAGGALGAVDAFFCVPDNSSKNRLEIYGSQGSVLFQNTIGQGPAGEATAFLEPAASGYDARQARADAAGRRLSPRPVNTYRAEIEEFSQALLDRRDPANSAALGLQSQKVIDACYQSARTGKAVAVR